MFTSIKALRPFKIALKDFGISISTKIGELDYLIKSELNLAKIYDSEVYSKKNFLLG